ncbi:tyrosine-protein phosphatase non-receptor type 2-like protein [Leptotrombidium deliense]|uniref:protein-tyrosine-phosphatase n=1 Tax=Leptotrombidium deliense TaxID=299467 RepID=A0A443SFD2_9ACAR|nr:tyrosine-protein phosphatase non-receptor type 2-like protein [Leptotrombidium deliense]
MEAEFKNIEQHNLWSSVYQEIRIKSAKYKFSNKESKKSENKTLNRYRDVTPFDHSRVVLKRCHNNYINASLIKVENAERAYILTQGPLPATISHFWLMVWEQNSKAIIMLNRLMERGTIKCHQYWPDGLRNNDVDKISMNDVFLEVEYVSQEEQSHYITRNFVLTDLQSGQSREIIQYHYTSWPDFGLPESPSSFLEFLFATRSSEAFDQGKNGPPIIHCSAGIGRSGTLCLVDTCLVLIEKSGDGSKVDVRNVLLEMRKYRMGLIQTPEQLRFSYMAIAEGAKSLISVPSSTSADDCGNTVHKEVCEDETDEEIFNKSDDEKSPTLPLLPPRQKRSQSFSSQNSSKLLNESNEMKGDIPQAVTSNSISKEDTKLLNNNLTPTEIRKRNREERNRKTSENIRRIKEKQKEIDERSRLKKRLLKYGCISVGIALMFGAGFIAYSYLNDATVLKANAS